MKIKNLIICISLLIILLNISCAFASQEVDTGNTLTASDSVVEVSNINGLQENMVSDESDLSSNLGSSDNEDVLCKTSDKPIDDSVLAASSDNKSLGANKQISTKLITPSRIIGITEASNGYTYQIILKDVNNRALSGKKVSFDFNGKTLTAKTDKNGWAKVKLTANVGFYKIKVTFAGDSNYAKISQDATIKVVKEYTKFVAPGRVLYLKDVYDGYQYPTILKTASGLPIADKKVLLTVDDKKQVVMTDKNGYANFNIKLDAPGSYVISLKFAGTLSGYYGVSETRNLKLIKESTKILAPGSKVIELTDIIDGYNYSAILKTKDNVPIANKKITVKFNNKQFTAKTDKNGWATLTLVAAKAGVNNLEIKFDGDNCFYAATEHRTLKIVDSGNPYGYKAKKVWINSDSGSDDMKKAVAELLRKNGWTVYVGQTYSNAHYTDYFKVTSDYQAYITLYNGFCAGTIREAYSDSIQNTLNKKGVTLVVMWDTRDWVNPDGMGPYRYGDFTGYSASRAWDDNFSVGDPSIKDVAGYLKSHNAKYCAYPTAEGLVTQFLAGGYFAMHP